MPTNTIDRFLRREMLPMVSEVADKRPQTFLVDRYFKNTSQSDTDTLDMDIERGGRATAAYVNPLVEGQVVNRLGFETRTYRPPTLKPKMKVTYDDLLKRVSGEILYENKLSPEARLGQLLAKDAMYLENLITRAEAIQAAQGLFQDQVKFLNVAGVAVNTAISFGRPAANVQTLTGSTGLLGTWSTATIDPMVLIEYNAALIQQQTGLIARDVILGRDAWNIFINNKIIQDKFKNVLLNGVDQLYAKEINAQGATLRAFLNGFSFFTFDDWYADPDPSNVDSAGEPVLQPMVPVNSCTVIAQGARFTRAYGAIKHPDQVAAVRRYPVSYLENDPPIRYFQVYSSPLMVVSQPDAITNTTVS